MNSPTMRRIWFAAAVMIAAAGLGHAPASAKERVDSFDGSCSLQGSVKFSPPATNIQQSLSVRYDAGGTCSGTLNGRAVADAQVTVHHAAEEVDGSCQRADTTRPGRGAIRFADGSTIAYTFEFQFVATNGVFSFRGQRSGSAHGAGSFLTPRTPPDVAQRCAGEGVAEAPLDIALTTESPLVSKRRGTGEAGRPHDGGGMQGEGRGRKDGGQQANTFSGSCQFSGPVVFRPPLTNTPQPVRQRARAQGACSGTFVDRRGRTHQLSEAPATFSETSRGDDASCSAGTATGRGVLRFQHGKIRFAFSETRVSGAALVSLEGAKGGLAHGAAAVSRNENPVEILQQCAGSGLKRVIVDGQLTTSPSISG